MHSEPMKTTSLPKSVSESSRSLKHSRFVSEPMGEKLVYEVAGIRDVLGGRLTKKGFNKAYTLLGKFLVLHKKEELFIAWLKKTCGANANQARDCFQCLDEWTKAYI